MAKRIQGGAEARIEGANFRSRTIWTADNLAMMRGMNSDCVDLVYLDPPFNSNRDYSAPIGSKAAGAAFKDTWTLDDVSHNEHGELARRNEAAYDVIKAAGSCHGKGMMAYLVYLGLRLMEIERIVKPTGSVYLHCDDTAGAYLRVLMDAVFGAGNFRAEITWRRSKTKGNATRAFGRVSDRILFYAGEGATFNAQFAPLGEDYIAKSYRHDDGDGRGRYRHSALDSPGGNGYFYEWRGYSTPANGWRCPEETMQRLHDEGRLHYPDRKSKRIALKRYLSDSKGTPVGNVWDDIGGLQHASAETLGYPTQKPQALLERIVAASSNPGDLVFDPFCGCATTLAAAEALGRKWVGCDISQRAVDIVKERLGWTTGIKERSTLPRRTDQGKIDPPQKNKDYLYGLQGGYCKGCNGHYPPKLLEVDHIEPKSKGGTDHVENLQLLCSPCNRSKGGRNMVEWRAAKKKSDRG